MLAFVDLLGQQQRLRELDEIPAMEDETAMSELHSTIENTYGVVKSFRQYFRDYIDKKYEQAVPDTLPLKYQKEFRRYQGNDIKINQFSDFTVMFSALKTNVNAKAPIVSVTKIMAALASSALICLANGHPLRGGIDIGWGIEFKRDEIYGGALAKAYSLESNIAMYPRIVVGDQLYDFLRHEYELGSNSKDMFSQFCAAQAGQCLEYLAIDDDGVPFIDFLGPSTSPRDEDDKEVQAAVIEIVKRAYNNVLESSAKYQTERDSKIAFKYSLLRAYVESRLHLWGIPVQR